MTISDKYLFSDPSEASVLAEVLNHRQLSGTSAVIDEYEAALSAFFNSRFAVATSSGSAAIHAALLTIGVEAGDEIIIPAIAPIPSGLPILTLKAIPVFVDVLPGGIEIDLDDLQKKISPKTKCVMTVPLWGYPISLAGLRSLIDSKGIPLIEDAAQAHGASLDGRLCGTHGAIGCFSTHDRKILSTGEGGFILTDSQDLANRIRRFCQLGFLDGEHYGVNYKISSLAAGLGVFRINRIQSQIEIRAANARKILGGIQNADVREIGYSSAGKPNYYSLTLHIQSGTDVFHRLSEALLKLGIQSDAAKYGYTTLYNRPLFSQFRSQCPHADALVKELIQIPVHPGLSSEEVDALAETIFEATS
ncbi:MAG TPA: aminotransferase class I/II-fold pyridoxal phosphate-dependent enzyme [Blastocatellia bacterium]|nr:aminotransferase class I/II-fold pyridoxal phosphate-dependent enzyme [Blastocatellia bacterium]